MSLDHINKAVLVTGGAQRLGAAIARGYGRAGWHVVVHYRASGAAAESLARSLPSAETVQCDLSDSDAAIAMVEQLATRLPDWRVLVNNASTFAEDRFDALDPLVNAAATRVNAVAPVRMAQAFLARARSAAGRRVIQLTDQKLRNPNPDFFSYTMSKHAVDAAAVMLAMTCKGADRVYRLAPGAILPSHDQTDAEAEISHRMNPLARRTGADEVADAALFLATAPLASGQALYIDSGQHLLSQPRDVLYLARSPDAGRG
ncbi:SDR family oxidoreductase [Alteraurantiacibacter palmitatis]|uniref:SDR family oxidoreductase n=1 Tax=Alteraurantiacibacter palmitatis TaxID=2054628 RepID=A0ABV7E6L5_9SPHN